MVSGAATTGQGTTERGRYRWRVVDIVIAAVLAVAAGVVFWGWDAAWTPLSKPLDALLPGLDGLLGGVWLLPTVLVPLIVRKPGAAVFAEIVASTVEALLGSQWAALTLLSGLIQGLGAELVFALFLYRSWRLWTALLAGAGAAVGLSLLDLSLYYAGATSVFVAIYAASSIASGAVVAGVGGRLIVRGIASTGALHRFAAGRTANVLV